ncbi:MAG TPA: PAS domain S-box protein, partial [Anaerolineae bacterium]|nr:PAS domain S-box protein [Anaerolineae bacterium]
MTRELPHLRVRRASGAKGLAGEPATDHVDLVLIHAHLDDPQGRELLQAARTHCAGCPVILCVSTVEEEAVSGVMGAVSEGSYATSQLCLPGLSVAVQFALERAGELQSMRDAELRYRTLFEGVPVGFYRTLPQGQIVDANPALVQMLAHPDQASLLAVNAADLYLNPEDRSRWMFTLARSRSVRNFHAQLRCYDGQVIWVNNNARAVQDRFGHVLYYEGTLEDITERKRTEEALQESEKRFRTLVEQAPIGVQILTPDGWTRSVNRAWERLWSVGLQDLQHYNMLEDEQLRRLGILPHIERAFAGEGTSTPTVEYDARDTLGTGRKRWVQAHIYPVKDERGRVCDVIMMQQDVTHRRQAEEDLRASEERFRTLVEQSPISIQILTPDGWTVQINDAYTQLWGVTLDELREYNMLRDEQARALGIMPYIETAFAGQATSIPPAEYDAWETVRKGKKRWFQARIYPVKGKDGDIRNVILMHEDITPQKQAEEELRRRAEHLEILNAENARLLEAVTQQKEELQRLSAQVIRAQEAERKRLSRELHDEFGQALTAMRINLAALERALPLTLEPQVQQRVTETAALVDQTLEQVRELSADLRPLMLDDLGLVPTLHWYVNRYGARAGIDVRFEAVELGKRLAPEVETV